MAGSFTVYRVTAPNSKTYIGYTGMSLAERWRHHILRAHEAPIKHPFYAAIRHFGASVFTVEALSTHDTRTDAQKAEEQAISATPLDMRFNLSPGGVADAAFGGKMFWKRINEDPAQRAAYLAKLSRAKLNNDWTDYDVLTEKAAQWRKDNPREAYKLAYRAIRLARQAQQLNKQGSERSLKDRLLWKHNRSAATRKMATEVWASRDKETRAAIGESISRARKKQLESKTHEELQQQTKAARAAIDRDRQGKLASAGLKSFWAQLRADPVRYTEYINRRKISLARTLEEKKRENV